ncbi:MAG: protein kinase [Planctomycetes bacterium]|nr:protein kinase [Planctomycetota bacterium]
MTTPERHEKVYELFVNARKLDDAARAAFLAKACADDPSLREEVEALLAQGSEMASFLEQPPAPTPLGSAGPDTLSSAGKPSAADSRADDALAGIVIEGYEILRELHRGGQGVVFQAIQKSTKRKVAIKVLREGPYASKSAQKRFEREIELVAQLKHPNIIAIFDSGTTAGGWQYCAMDYVRGTQLNHHIRENKLTLEETLEVFKQVCDAVQYAHHKGVIHRDLKPSNILVDSEGNAKVLDFGLAKQMIGPIQTVVSMTQEIIGTLPYMSPEQAKGNPDHIDTRTDIYALGVILYEILTGHYPYPVVGQMADVLKHIAETPPTPPSSRWTPDSGVTKRSSKHLRAGKCPIDDELQTVILKTLAKERERRYQSAGALAEDISHYLANEPIEAKRDSGWYVLRKTIQRFKVAFVVSTIVFLVIVAALVVSTAAWQSETEQRRNAQAATKLAASFYESMMEAGEVLENIKTSDVETGSREYLVQAIAVLDSPPTDEFLKKFVIDTEVERLAEEGYEFALDFDRLVKAIKDSKAEAKRLASEGRESEAAAERLVNEGRELEIRQRITEAHSKYDEALAVKPDDYKANGYKAFLLKGEYFAKELSFRDPELLEQSMEYCKRALESRPDSHASWNLLSILHFSLGNLKEAERAARRCLEVKSDYFHANTNLAKILALQKKFDEALTVAEKGVSASLKEERKKHADGIWRVVGAIQMYLGKPDALRSLLKAEGINHRDTRNLLLLSRIYMTLPGLQDNDKALEKAKLAVAFTGLKDPRFKRVLAQALLRNGEYVDAVTNATAALTQGDAPAYCHLIAAVAEARLGNVEKAKRHLEDAAKNWPAEFQAGEDVIVTAEKGLLWFDTAAELESLRAEAQQLLESEPR